MEEDIQFNVEAKYKSLDDLQKKLEDIEKQFKGFSKIKISGDIQKQLESIITNIEDANKALDIAQNNVIKARNKKFEADISGDTKKQGTALRNLQTEENRLAILTQFVKTNTTLKEEAEKIKSAYNLQKEINFIQQIDEKLKSIGLFYKQAEEKFKLTNAQNALAEFELSLDPAKKKLVELQSQLEQARQQFIKLNYDGQDTKGTEVAIKRLTKQIENTKKATKKTSSSWETLMNRIKNISIYRMIRTGLHWITSGFQEGINNLVQYDDSANKTMSNLNASLTQIKNTMGIAFASVLQSLEPIITTVADSLVDLVNSFNVAMAKMQGKNVYTKAKKNVDDYAKSLKSAKKLSFDTFEVLSGDGGKTQPFEMFEEESVKEGTNATSKTFEKLLEIGKSLFSILTKIWKNIIEPAMPTLLGIAKILLTIIGTIVTIIDKLNLIYPIIFAIIALKVTSSIRSLIGSFKSLGEIFVSVKTWFKNYNLQCASAKTKTDILKASALSLGIALVSITGAIVSLVANWDKMSVNAKNWAIGIAVLTASLSALAFAFYASSGNWAKAISVASGVITAGTTVMTAISGFENGGIPAKSELFYMNENGIPEALVNTGGSQTNVINIDQLSEGMRRGFVQAIYETGLIDAMQQRIIFDNNNINDNAFARAIFPALKTESTRRGGNQL